MPTLRSFWEKKTKYLPGSEDFLKNKETWGILGETKSNEVKILGSLRFFENVSQKFGQYIKFSGH